MTSEGGAFRLTRTAAGKIPTQRKSPEVFPVVIVKGVQKFQRKEGRKWVTVCTVPDGEKGRKNLRYHFGTVLGRAEGKQFRFVVLKK